MSNSMTDKSTIVIFTAKLARNLLKDGFTIVDIKPDKTDQDGKRSVFVFKKEKDIEKLVNDYGRNDDQRR